MATYKHIALVNEGLATEGIHFVWYSEDADATKSNPYPAYNHPVTFRTTPATADEAAEYAKQLEIKTRITDRSSRLAIFRALRGRSLTAAEIKQAVELIISEVLDGR